MSRRKSSGDAFVKHMNDFATNFKSRKEFAEHLGVSRQTLGFWLNGERTPDMDNLVLISNVLHVSIDYLVGNPYRQTDCTWK